MPEILRLTLFSLVLLSGRVILGAQECTPAPGPPLFLEDFGSGPNPGPSLPLGTTGFVYGSIGVGSYLVSNSSGINGQEWHEGEDHTAGDTDGYMLLFNAGENPQLFYQHTFTDLCPNTEYIFTCYLANLTVPTACIGNSVRPHVQFTVINPADERILLRTTNGRVFIRSRLTFEENNYRFRTGPDQHSARIELTNFTSGVCGNDLALDDISLHLCNPQIEQNVDLCELPNGIIKVGENSYSEPGTYLDALPIADSCNDTLVTTIISGERRRLPTLRYTFCQGDTLSVAGNNYTNNTNFVDTLVGEDPSCPQFQAYEIIAQTPLQTNQDTVLCQGDSMQVGISWYSQSGTYIDTLSTLAGCDSIVTTTIQTGQIELELSPSIVEIEAGESIQLNSEVRLSSDFSLSWQPTQFLSCTDCPAPLLSPSSAGIYRLVATDIPSACMAIASLEVYILSCEEVYVPNAFSPNGDEVNDYFRFFAEDCFTQLVAWEIFDRWGGLVYKAEPQALSENIEGWDGRVHGQAAIPGVYIYQLVLQKEDGTQQLISGEVVLFL